MRNDRWQNHIIPNILCVLAMIAIALWALGIPSFGQATNATSQQIEISSQVAFGLGYQSNQTLLNHVESGTTTAKFALQTTVFVAPSAANQAINLATLFPSINSAICWGMQDISSPGQSITWGTSAASSTSFTQAAGGFMLSRVNGSAPTIYVNNADATNYAILKVFCLAN